MSAKPKIKIKDDNVLRKKIYELYIDAPQVVLVQWSIALSKHILKVANIDYLAIDAIIEGFKINKMFQSGKVKMRDIRKASLNVHELACESENEITKAALRAAGQAIATVHVKEHATISSDYAIKVINLVFKDNMEAIKSERLWQLQKLLELKNG